MNAPANRLVISGGTVVDQTGERLADVAVQRELERQRKITCRRASRGDKEAAARVGERIGETFHGGVAGQHFAALGRQL